MSVNSESTMTMQLSEAKASIAIIIYRCLRQRAINFKIISITIIISVIDMILLLVKFDTKDPLVL